MGSSERWTDAARASAVPWCAALGGAAGAVAANTLDLQSVDARFVAVGLGVALPLLLAHVLRPDAKLRVPFAIAGALWLACLVAPRSSIAVSWLSGGVLFLGAASLVHAGRCAWRLPHPRGARVALSVVAVAPGLYLWLAAAVVLVNTQLAIAPVRLAHQRPRVDADEQVVRLNTRDAYTIEGTYTRGAPGAGGVLLVHGVSDGRDRWLPWVERLRAEGLHALRIDVRGHGRSDGAVLSYGQREVEDVRAGLTWLAERDDVRASRLLMVGTSMGGGIVLAASRDAPVYAAIALAPASRYPRLVAQRTALLGPLGPLVLNGSAHLARAVGQIPMTEWSPADRMSRRLPILVLHGTSDRTIPIELSRELARRREHVSLLELDSNHDDLPANAAAHAWPAIRAFMRDSAPRP